MNTLSERIIEISAISYPRELEEYQHDGVIGKFRDEWDVDEKEAREIFSEMKKFLYISEIAQQKCMQIEIDEPTLIIDKMWHHFILFTNDYEAFCKKFFGKFLHHIPFSAEHLAQSIKDSARSGMTLHEHKQMRLGRQLELIESILGIETVKKWYVEFANSYSPSMMNSLQRAVFHGDMEKLAVPIDPRLVEKFNASELIQGILRQVTPSAYCGAGCGMYCTCNSTRMPHH